MRPAVDANATSASGRPAPSACATASASRRSRARARTAASSCPVRSARASANAFSGSASSANTRARSSAWASDALAGSSTRASTAFIGPCRAIQCAAATRRTRVSISSGSASDRPSAVAKSMASGPSTPRGNARPPKSTTRRMSARSARRSLMGPRSHAQWCPGGRSQYVRHHRAEETSWDPSPLLHPTACR